MSRRREEILAGTKLRVGCHFTSHFIFGRAVRPVTVASAPSLEDFSAWRPFPANKNSSFPLIVYSVRLHVSNLKSHSPK